MSHLEQHAERELRAAGLFDADGDYNGGIGPAVMKLIRAITGDGHSGGSAQLTLAAFNRVVQFKTLTPLTSSPDEWMEIGEDKLADSTVPVWQSIRQPSCFSNDGGKTYYDIDANDDRAIKTAVSP